VSRSAVAFLLGLLFGAGLIVSQMSNPAKVIGFLDLAGDWDPSLAFVMMGAVAVFGAAYRLSLRRGAPLLESKFQAPEKQGIDQPLLLGAALFGVGWGLAGFCPGPAVVAAGFGDGRVWAFIGAMAAGVLLLRLLRSARPD
jgi:uncharacterized membrane protein YedE/YeeE